MRCVRDGYSRGVVRLFGVWLGRVMRGIVRWDEVGWAVWGVRGWYTSGQGVTAREGWGLSGDWV